MTVKELIEKLKKLPKDAEVVVAGHKCRDCFGDQATTVELHPDNSEFVIIW